MLIDLAFIAAGVGVLCMLGIITARVFRPDTNLLFIWANAYTFWIYLPAYFVLLASAVFRRWIVFAMALTVAAFHLAWVLPDYRPAEDIPAEALAAPRIRLMTANVYFQNPDYTAIAQEILAEDPDVLFLQEYGPELEEALIASGVTANLPFSEIAYENPFFGSAVYSRLPLEDVRIISAGGRPIIRANVEVAGTLVTLYNLHPTSPGFGPSVANDWNDGWEAITTELASRDGAVIAAGDFNLNQHHQWYRTLKNDGLDNCHEERGRGNATTWPKGRKLRPIRIDHVFHSPEVVCLSIREGSGEGSDHRPLIADLAILGFD